jgi:predicted TIM-barrel fold metal-dependent hydrolase
MTTETLSGGRVGPELDAGRAKICEGNARRLFRLPSA